MILNNAFKLELKVKDNNVIFFTTNKNKYIKQSVKAFLSFIDNSTISEDSKDEIRKKLMHEIVKTRDEKWK